MPKFGRTSEERLRDLHPLLVVLCRDVIQVVDITILETYRGEEKQNRLFNEGKSKLMFPRSRHNQYPSQAVDVAPWINGRVPWDDLAAFHRMLGVFEAFAWQRDIKIRSGLDWDRDWDHTDNVFNDGPHIELVL